MCNIWNVFVGEKGDQLEIFNSKTGPFPPEPGNEGYICIGWPAVGDMRLYKDNYNFYIDKFRIVYPDKNERTFKTKANMVWYFAHSMKKDDWVICPSSTSDLLLVGKVISDYVSDFHNELELYGKKRIDFVHARKVKWLHIVGKADSKYANLNRVGQLTISKSNLELNELKRILTGI